jgi:hypothetical protein
MDGNSPYPPGYGAAPGDSGPPAPPNGPGYSPQPTNFDSSGAPARKRSGLITGGVVLAVLLGIAALVLSIVSLVRGPDAAPKPETPKVSSQELFVDDADKPLCEAISPLMREESDRTNAFLRTGAPESQERLDAIAKFKTDTLDWANRIQPVLNEYAEPPRYLTRTLQRYIDGMLLYSENMYKERGPDPFDNTTYDSAIVALGGPLGTCYKVGVRW